MKSSAQYFGNSSYFGIFIGRLKKLGKIFNLFNPVSPVDPVSHIVPIGHITPVTPPHIQSIVDLVANVTKFQPETIADIIIEGDLLNKVHKCPDTMRCLCTISALEEIFKVYPQVADSLIRGFIAKKLLIPDKGGYLVSNLLTTYCQDRLLIEEFLSVPSVPIHHYRIGELLFERKLSDNCFLGVINQLIDQGYLFSPSGAMFFINQRPHLGLTVFNILNTRTSISSWIKNHQNLIEFIKFLQNNKIPDTSIILKQLFAFPKIHRLFTKPSQIWAVLALYGDALLLLQRDKRIYELLKEQSSEIQAKIIPLQNIWRTKRWQQRLPITFPAKTLLFLLQDDFRHTEFGKYHRKVLQTRNSKDIPHMLRLIPTLSHRTCEKNILPIFTTGALFCNQAMRREDFAAGISTKQDMFAGDGGLVSLSVGNNIDCHLQGLVRLDFDTLSLFTEKHVHVVDKCIFKLSDWTSNRENNVIVNLSNNLTIEMDWSETLPKGTSKVKFLVTFRKTSDFPVITAMVEIPAINLNYAGFDNGLYYHLIDIFFYIITNCTQANPELGQEIIRILNNQTNLTDYIDDCLKQLLQAAEIAFFRSVPVTLQILKRIDFSSRPREAQQEDRSQEVLDIQKNLWDIIEKGSFEQLEKTLHKFHELTAAPAMIQELIAYATMKNRHDIDAQLRQQYIRETSAKTKKIIQTESHINELLTFLTREPTNTSNTLISFIYDQDNNKVIITTRLGSDIRNQEQLQYDATRLIMQSLRLADRSPYIPSRHKEIDIQSKLEFKLDGSGVYDKDGQQLTHGKQFSSLEEILAAFMKTSLNLILAGGCWNDESLDPNKTVRPSYNVTQEFQSPFDRFSAFAATSYLNSHDGILESLAIGDIEMFYNSADGCFYITPNKLDKIEAIAKILCDSLHLNFGTDLVICGEKIKCSAQLLINSIRDQACNYVSLHLVVKETGKMLFLKRWHLGTNAPAESAQVVGYCGAGGSAAFPYDPLKSAIATLIWKMGVEPGQDQYEIRFIGKQQDVAYCYVTLPQCLMEKMQIARAFYDPQCKLLLSPAELNAMCSAGEFLPANEVDSQLRMANLHEARQLRKLLSEQANIPKENLVVKIVALRTDEKKTSNYGTITITPTKSQDTKKICALLDAHQIKYKDRSCTTEKFFQPPPATTIVIKDLDYFNFIHKFSDPCMDVPSTSMTAIPASSGQTHEIQEQLGILFK